MIKPFIKLFSFLIFQMMIVGNLFAQSNLNAPEVVEAGQDYVITWSATSWKSVFNVNVADEVSATSMVLERLIPPNQWVKVYDGNSTPLGSYSAGSYSTNDANEGVYYYRLNRSARIFDEESFTLDCGYFCDKNDFTDWHARVEVIQVRVESSEPQRVLCHDAIQEDCLSLQTPQSFIADKVPNTNSAIISWQAVSESGRYELEVFDRYYNQWAMVYVGDALSYTYEELNADSNQFRIKACYEQWCGESSTTEEVYIERIIDTTHQCEPAFQG